MTKLILVLCCLVALGMGASLSPVTVTPFTDCTQCGVMGVLFPSSTTYLMLTSDDKLWLSIDEGQHWQSVLTNIAYMEASPVDPLSIIIISNSGTLYTSIDGGKTTSRISSPVSSLSGITMHPSQPAWLLVYSCNAVVCNTFYSKDFGKTWQSGPGSLLRYYILWSNDNATLDTIFAVRSDGSFSYTTNYGTSWKSLFKNSIGYVLTSHYLYVGVVKSGTTAQLYSSSNRNDASHTDPNYYWLAEFPTGNNLPQQGYTFLDDTTRAEFIAVKQPSNTNYWGSVYSSDFDGDQFALSLNFVAQEDLLYDFDKFSGLSGIYLANAYPTATSPSTARQTMFSWDNGGEWKKLVAPSTNSLGIPTNCSMGSGCSLHVHGLISWYNDIFPPFYSSPNAIGLMVAVGNLGSALATDTKSSKTYLTRDAGITWSELYPQPTIYEFGDHGGILVFAPISAPTNSIYYSLDEGKTTQTFQLPNSLSLYVDNIFIEPQGTGLKFVLIGHTGSGPTAKNYIYGLDFSTLGLPACQDSDYENWSPSNNDAIDTFCFMGSTTIYKRRKQDSKCYNGDTDHIVQQTPCPCEWEDYECDVGFTASPRNATDYFECSPIHSTPACATGYRQIPDTSCDISSGIDLRAKSCPGYSGTPTTTSTIPTTTATDSTTTATTSSDTISSSTMSSASSVSTSTTGSPSQTTAGTTGTPNKGGHGGAVVAIVLLLIILFGGAGTVGFLYYKNEHFRDWVLSKFSRTPSAQYGRVNTDENDEEGGN